MHRKLLVGAVAVCAASTVLSSVARSETDDMNPFTLAAYRHLDDNYSNGGYDLGEALTHDLDYNGKWIKATNPTLSMCVGGMLEIIIHSFDLYAKAENDRSFYDFLPVRSWAKLGPTDIRSHIWVSPKPPINSYGTGDAFAAFGIGERLTFAELRAGDFVNFDRPPFPGHRKRASGHAVLFLSYIDDKGNDVAGADRAAGFRYFSHQGSTNGFGEKRGFFLKDRNKKWFCPKLANADCGIRDTTDQRYLNAGRLWPPSKWDAAKRDSYLADLKDRLFAESKTKGSAVYGVDPDLGRGEFDVQIDEVDNIVPLGPLFSGPELPDVQ